MVRNLSIRSRILAVLALPVLVLVAAAATFSWNGLTAARDAAAMQRAVQAVREVPALVAALDAERTASARLLDGDSSASEDVIRARATTDPLLQGVTTGLQQVDASRLSEGPARAIAAAVATFGQVDDVRAVVDQGQQSGTLVSATYETAIGAQSALPGALADDAGPAAADALRASTSLQQLVGFLADERDVGSRALQTGAAVDSAERTTLVGIAAQIATTRPEAVRLSRSAGVQIPQPSVAVVQMRAAVEGDPDSGFPLPSVESWRSALNAEIAALTPSAQALAATSADAVAREAADARRSALTLGAGALAAVVVPLFIALLIVRSITEPLRALTRAAGQVRERLPRLVEAAHSGDGTDGTAGAAPEVELEPIPVRGRDEIGRLAAAFNEVNATTVQVAQEQAALRAAIASTFVTVARRDQALLNRQLSFIDTLERAEEDPHTLEDLFTLDHLATRMRRNAESLLVLAGIDSGRRLRVPMPLSDVVRTASSEIEDYRRVDLALGADPAVLGHLALPAAHLLAELLENATRSSDPSTRVRVATSPMPTGVLLTVTDEGIGMTPTQRAEVAARLADPSASAAVGASELGYFVVGRIARRLGASVEVHAGAVRGTVVAVALPATVFAGSVESIAPDDRAARPALPVRGTATGALPAVSAAGAALSAAPLPSAPLPAVRLPETGPAAVPGPVPEHAVARGAQPASAVAPSTGRTRSTGGLPRRAPRAAEAAQAARRARTGALPAVPAASLDAVQDAPAAMPGDPAVARRSAVFRTFAARRGQLDPTAVPDIDLTALRSPLTASASSSPATATEMGTTTATGPSGAGSAPRPTSLSALDEAVAEPYAPVSRDTGAAPSLPTRSHEIAAAAPAKAAPASAAPAPAAPASEEVRPMTRRELRALEASGKLTAVRNRRTGQNPPVPARSESVARRPGSSALPSQPTQAPRPETVPVASPLVPEPTGVHAPGAGAAAAGLASGLPAGFAAAMPAQLFTPVTAPATTGDTPVALPRRTSATAASAEGTTSGATPSTGSSASSWHAQPGAPLRPLRSMPPATGVAPALAAFETGRIPREPYRPAAVSAGGAPLARRAPTASAPTVTQRPPGGQHPPRRREPSEVRSMLAGYTSGVSRARRAPAGVPGEAQTKEDR
ncbi:Signal transduction histidine kinase [Quadrisphaera granulorum]|uniref:histidine kinase n=1 Tax=Quadrisphaera granulorum TaxID=317664 RepID=A0A316AEG6_9ACTN|nr:HAMP domain-containing histidine kinase [Quadrisphaera granulorum]PWJ55668.1 signal transduction histidine kinase [Quadrisphaera granulorum]SZE95165.1 Signal transduction histidine kinase [Quadrisphaera granulorum]